MHCAPSKTSAQPLGFEGDMFVLCVWKKVWDKKKRLSCSNCSWVWLLTLFPGILFLLSSWPRTTELKAQIWKFFFFTCTEGKRRMTGMHWSKPVFSFGFGPCSLHSVSIPLEERSGLWQPRGFEWHRLRVMGTWGQRLAGCFFYLPVPSSEAAALHLYYCKLFFLALLYLFALILVIV